MSKLNFVEHSLSDNSVSDSDNEMLDVKQSSNHDFLAKQKRAPSPESTDEEGVAGDFLNTPVVNEKKNKKKKNKKKKSLHRVDGTEIIAADTATNVLSTKSPIVTSGYLSAFLNKKRNFDISPPPDIEVSNNTYLKQFSEEFKHVVQSEEELESDDDESIVCEDLDILPPEGGEYVAIDVDPSEVVITAPKLSFYNLPYNITAEEITQFSARLGFPLVGVTLGFDKRKNLPSGSATVEYSMETDINACVTALQSENCGGRPVRVQKVNETKRRVSVGKEGSRYFLSDMSFKCQKCGQVGHKQYDCTNEPIPTPCHLCAGKDHEAVNCPNITCYRCGLFGHHSRDCRNAAMSRPVICTLCGSTTHDARSCRDGESGGRDARYDSRVEGRWIRCVSCNQFGHTMCQALPKLPLQKKGVNADVYCPNCGEKGHHIDFPPANGVGLCRAPKFEAYSKYPKLLLDIDAMPEDADSYYRALIRYNFHNDQALFPSLASSNAISSTNHTIANNNKNGRSFTDNFSRGDNSYISRSDNSNNNYCRDYDTNHTSGRGGGQGGGDYGNGRSVTPSRPPQPRGPPPPASTGSGKKRYRGDSDEDGSTDERCHKRKSWGSCNDTISVPQYSKTSSGGRSGGRWSEGGGGTRRVEENHSRGSSSDGRSRNKSEFDEKVEARRRRFGDNK